MFLQAGQKPIDPTTVLGARREKLRVKWRNSADSPSAKNGAALQGFLIDLEKSLPVACLPGVA
jgi:hypothetical protein